MVNFTQQNGVWFHPCGLPLAEGLDPNDVNAEITEELADGAPDKRALSQLATRHRDAVLAQGFVWRGKVFQSGPADVLNVTSAAALALTAINAGAQAGDLRWANPDADFAWLAKDNTRVPMDVYDVLEFGQTLAKRRTRIIFVARTVKDAIALGSVTTRAEIGALIW
jgi:hypothetical protein